MELTTASVPVNQLLDDRVDDIQRNMDRDAQILDIGYYNNDFLLVCHLINSTFGIIFNLLLIGAIVLLKRLRLPRNFTWIGIGISNICILTAYIVTQACLHFKSSFSTRSLCTWFTTVAVANQTVSFLLAQLERHIFITYPKWHLTNVTVGWIIAVQLSCSLLIFLLGNLVNLPVFGEYLTQYFSSENFNIIGSFILGFLPIILIGQTALMKTKTQRRYPSVEAVHLKSKPQEGQQPKYNRKRHFVIINNMRVKVLDFEAAQNVYFMGKVYLISSMIPNIVLFVLVSICFQMSLSEAEANIDCSSFVQVFYHLSAWLLCIHSSIVNPFAFVYSANDLVTVLKSTLGHKCSCRKN